MEKIWHILVNGKNEGPYSEQDLKRDPRITPDTKVWRKGFTSWVSIRNVPELKNLFKDEESDVPDTDELVIQSLAKESSDQLVLEMRNPPPNILLWLLIAAAGIIVFLFQLWLKGK